MTACLTTAQTRALAFVAEHEPGSELAARARSYISRVRCSLPEPAVVTDALTINFHPDRATARGVLVIEAILTTGRVLGQFETGTTNGFALGEKGDVRRRRESVLFGGAYDQASQVDRPKYGAVNLFSNPRGGWPRFGSSHWVLTPSVLPRCTVTVPGSHAARAWWGDGDGLARLVEGLPAPTNPLDRHRFRLIDGPVELQVHGELLLDRDVDALVLDPSFRGTAVAAASRRLERTHGVRLGWAPELRSDAVSWQLRSARSYSRARIRAAVEGGQDVTAAWIGADVAPGATQTTPLELREQTNRLLWNRLLLSQSAGFQSSSVDD
jgi:Protein of unknown function (DUF3626)